MKIPDQLVNAALFIAFLVGLSACSTTGVDHDYANFADRPGDRIHWIRVSDLGFVDYVRTEATLIGERDIEEDELSRVGGAALRGSEDLVLLASDRASRAIETFGAGADLGGLLEDYFNRLTARRYVPAALPTFEVVLLRDDEGISITRKALGLSRSSIPVLVQLNASSAQSMIVSLARQMAIIGHEVVHVADRSGSLSIPGGSSGYSMLNEEIFASLVESCDRFDNLLRLEVDGRKRIRLHAVPSDHPGDADAHFQALLRSGPSPAGKFLAGMIVHEGLPTGVPLDASEQQLLQERCGRLVEQPRDYLEAYVADGVPDRWDRYLVARDQPAEKSAD